MLSSVWTTNFVKSGCVSSKITEDKFGNKNDTFAFGFCLENSQKKVRFDRTTPQKQTQALSATWFLFYWMMQRWIRKHRVLANTLRLEVWTAVASTEGTSATHCLGYPSQAWWAQAIYKSVPTGFVCVQDKPRFEIARYFFLSGMYPMNTASCLWRIFFNLS